MKNVRLADGSLENLAIFLRNYGSQPEGWPQGMCCPDCGARVEPKIADKLLREEKNLTMLEVRVLQDKTYENDDKALTLGGFKHADEAANPDCLSSLDYQFIAQHPLLTRFTYLNNLERDPRMRNRVENMLKNFNQENNKRLGQLLRANGPVDCMKQPHARKLFSFTFLETCPTAFPMLLAVLADKFDYSSSRKKHKVFYRMDDGKNEGEYVNYEGEVVKGKLPKHIQMCYADSGNFVSEVKKIVFPAFDSELATPPRVPAPAVRAAFHAQP